MTLLKNVTIYTGENKIENGYVNFDQTINEVGQMSSLSHFNDSDVIDGNHQILVPGFIDVHCHGGYDTDFMDGDPESIVSMVDEFAANGVTSVFATTMTQSDGKIEAAIQGIKTAMNMTNKLVGIHLEGPFINGKHRGAQPEECIRNFDSKIITSWQRLADDNIKLVTVAPEKVGYSEFAKTCDDLGIKLSAGHTDAKFAELEAANIKRITHLYDAQREFHHREVGPLGYTLLRKPMVEIITDGFHVSNEAIKIAYQSLGSSNIELVTDSMRARHSHQTISELGGQRVIVSGGQARLENGKLAGSVLDFTTAFKNIISMTGCEIEDAVKMSSTNQAREFGLTKKGKLLVGFDADFNLLNHDLDLIKTYSLGKATN
ncbi:N-acetylglucosamine-6-phosphate deacetylase [Lentilactobacillus sp. Marseille-Q4993]|uniref:N-acetylglucosamine-6-phosphate deacetylase n=1 Tax=Lentilactobacillus sp. Marseille-Q4993 TaxID=3039492 RepID=UPI0024BD2B43|nr:N-acetylglucosamine-6-phosphate deacetylase [Lentilactobacillus sp. Marseille-Q4993]